MGCRAPGDLPEREILEFVGTLPVKVVDVGESGIVSGEAGVAQLTAGEVQNQVDLGTQIGTVGITGNRDGITCGNS